MAHDDVSLPNWLIPSGRFRGAADYRFIAAALLTIALLTSGCSSLGAAGPSTAGILSADRRPYGQDTISVVELDFATLHRVRNFEQSQSFADVFGDAAAQDPIIGAGDTLEVTIWEAPPAVLFGSVSAGSDGGIGGAQGRSVLQQVVGTDGWLSVPFVGRLSVGGQTLAEIEREILKRLSGRANDPQVIVRLAQNEARTVTVLGEVTSSRRVPIGPRGERLLDFIASAGGPRQAVAQTTIQLSRGKTTLSMPLDRVVQDPSQNVRLRANDVVTALYQPFTFIALGAVSRNSEIPFDGKGISLAQALARTGGLRDDRANIRGVFIFRLERPDALASDVSINSRRTVDNRIPVVYRINLTDASGFFLAQDFIIHDKDVLYVSTAPGADLQRFLTTVSSLAFSTISIGNASANISSSK
jgi:polysaccharide export outer membrane protein